jgi:hypothetical protein
MTGKEFWLRWRREIVRGAVTFVFVVAGGLAIASMVRRGKERVRDFARSLDIDPDFSSPDRQHAPAWTYSVPLTTHQTLWLRNLNGSVSVEPAAGRNVEISADRSFRHADPQSVQLLTVPSRAGVTVCAVWPGSADSACGAGGRYEMHRNNGGSDHHSDVAVVFTVKLPRGVQLDASTINGQIEVHGATAPVTVETINGEVMVETTNGPVEAKTINGDAHAIIRGFGAPGNVVVRTTHGDATVELPENLDANVTGHTVTGDISSDFDLPVTGKFASKSLSGTLGKGGRGVDVQTVAGDILIRKVGPPATPEPPRVVPPPAAPTKTQGRTPPPSGKS